MTKKSNPTKALRAYRKAAMARIKKIEMKVHKRWSRVGRQAKDHFGFLGRWHKKTRSHFRRFGAAIVRISPPWLRATGRFIARPFRFFIRHIKALLARRPHRSFRLTRRRDYKRSLALPGYWAFTNTVRAMLWKHKKLFGGLMAIYFLVALAIGGFGQQDAYANLSSTLTKTGGELFQGNWGQVSQAGLLLVTSVTTGLTPNVTQAQSVLGGLAAFFGWLATVWALRNVMAGRKVYVRDAIYSSGSPVISTVLVGFILMLQLFPIAIAILVYNAAIASELVSGGVEQMLLWLVLAMLGVLSLYWITSTIIGLVVVTLPGMYPFQAIRTAGDLVVGRRLRILFRLVWLACIVVITWALIAIPMILLDSWLKKVWPVVEWFPTVPLTLLLLSAVTLIWAASYVYMLYRKVVDDDAIPA